MNKRFPFISEAKGSQLLYCTIKSDVSLSVDVRKKRQKDTMEVELDSLVGVKGWKAVGNKFSSHPITKIRETSGAEVVETEIKEESVESPMVDDAGSKDNGQSDAVVKKPQPSASKDEEIKPVDITPEKKPKNEAAKSEEKKIVKEKQAPKSELDSPDEGPEEGDGFHAGDTVDMKIDLSKLKKGRDQLGLFDE